METKKCSCCGKELPLSEFYLNKSKHDGHSNYCKECNKQIQRDFAALKKVKMANAKHEEEQKAKAMAEVQNQEVVVQLKPVEPVREKTLDDFQPRELIKHLYKLGYRIEDNRLVCYVRQTVNVKDIINA